MGLGWPGGIRLQRWKGHENRTWSDAVRAIEGMRHRPEQRTRQPPRDQQSADRDPTTRLRELGMPQQLLGQTKLRTDRDRRCTNVSTAKKAISAAWPVVR